MIDIQKLLSERVVKVLCENKTKRVKLIDVFGDLPDEDELIWQYIGLDEFYEAEFPVQSMKLSRIVDKEFIENFNDYAEGWQKKYVKDIVADIESFKDKPIIFDFENKVVIDGNHKLMAFYLAGLEYVNVIDINS